MVDVTKTDALNGLPTGAASTLVTSRCASPDGPTATPSRFDRMFASAGPEGEPVEHAAIVSAASATTLWTTRTADDLRVASRTKPIGTTFLLGELVWVSLLNPRGRRSVTARFVPAGFVRPH